MNFNTLTVFVPVFNEQFLLESSLTRLLVLGESPLLEKIQVIVVDDGSVDGTTAICHRLAQEWPSLHPKFDWLFLRHTQNQGKGAALQTALKHAAGAIFVTHDADLEYFPEDILRMLYVFEKEDADAVYGSRFLTHQYRRVLMFRHDLGNRWLTFFSNLISNINLTDMETCYKAVKTDLLKSLPLQSTDFRIEVELTMKLARREARIFEVPINYSGRTYQEGKKISWRDGFLALWAIIKFGFSDDIFLPDQAGGKILARLGRAVRFNGWMVDVIKPYIGQNVLEIGAGMENITRHIIPRQRYLASDINPYYLNVIDNLKIDKPYLAVTCLDVNHVNDFVQNHPPFDTIICLNVFEHLEDDLKAMLNISNLLADKGRAIVLVPQGPELFGTLDRVLGHQRRYSKTMLLDLAQQARLRVIEIIPFNRVSSLPWYINGRLFNKTTFGLFQIFMVNLLTPFLRRIDPYIPLPPLSIIAILEKQN